MKIRIFLLLLLLPWLAFSNPILEQANAAFQNKKYAEAARQYEALLAEGYQDAHLYYNLGNAYFRQNQLGKAILNYERAYQLQPGDADIQHNLKVARLQRVDELEPLSPFFLSSWWQTLRSQLSANSWSILGVALLWLSATGGIIYLLGKSRSKRKQGFIASVVLFLLALLPFVMAWQQHRLEAHSRQAIVIEKQTELRAAPDGESNVILPLHEGTKVKLLDKISDWHKVRLVDGEEGWLSETVLEEV